MIAFRFVLCLGGVGCAIEGVVMEFHVEPFDSVDVLAGHGGG